MRPTAENWPIAAAMLPLGGVTAGGTPVQDASEAEWAQMLGEMKYEGFSEIDLTDSWVRPGDLSPERLDALARVFSDLGLTAPSISAIRRSVIDPVDADDNLAYSHRTLDAAAHLGVQVVSFGLHRPLLPEQAAVTWFWTVDGPHDSTDADTWNRAVTRLRELGEHAESVGVQVSLEMYEDTLLGSADSAVRLVHDIGHDHVGLNPDLGNIYRLNRPIEPFLESMQKCAPVMNFWHIKSYSRLEDPTTDTYLSAPAPMDSSTMNYRAAIKMALGAGFEGPFCVEHYGGDGVAVMARNREYIRRLLRFDLDPANGVMSDAAAGAS